MKFQCSSSGAKISFQHSGTFILLDYLRHYMYLTERKAKGKASGTFHFQLFTFNFQLSTFNFLLFTSNEHVRI